MFGFFLVSFFFLSAIPIFSSITAVCNHLIRVIYYIKTSLSVLPYCWIWHYFVSFAFVLGFYWYYFIILVSLRYKTSRWLTANVIVTLCSHSLCKILSEILFTHSFIKIIPSCPWFMSALFMTEFCVLFYYIKNNWTVILSNVHYVWSF